MFFRLLAAVPGMILGWILSRYLIAEFLYQIGFSYYTIDTSGIIAFTPHFFLSAFCVTAVTCGEAALSCLRSLKMTPCCTDAAKAPAQGHLILCGFAFMLAFTMIVNYMIGRKFKDIDMVESLKRVE